MTHNYHKQLPLGVPMVMPLLEYPFQQLDDAIGDLADVVDVEDIEDLTELPGNVASYTVTIAAGYDRVRHIGSLRATAKNPADIGDDLRFEYNGAGIPGDYYSVTVEQRSGANEVNEELGINAVTFAKEALIDTGSGTFPAGWRTAVISEWSNCSDTSNGMVNNGIAIRSDNGGLGIIRFGGIWDNTAVLTSLKILGNWGLVEAGSSHKTEGMK